MHAFVALLVLLIIVMVIIEGILIRKQCKQEKRRALGRMSSLVANLPIDTTRKVLNIQKKTYRELMTPTPLLTDSDIEEVCTNCKVS